MLNKLFAVFILLFFTFASPAFAVVKTSGFLEVTFDEPIFPSSIIWYPGLEETRSFIVRNKSSENKTVLIEAISESETNEMSKEYFFKVSENGTVLYGSSWSKTLKNFWDAGELNFGSLGSSEKKTYDISVLLPTSVGNDFQNKSANFDLKIGFEGTTDQVTVSTTTSASTPISSSIVNSNIPSNNIGNFFQEPEVLGTTENINSGISTESSLLIKVLGVQAPWWQRYRWILPLIIFGGLLLWWFLGKMRGNENH